MKKNITNTEPVEIQAENYLLSLLMTNHNLSESEAWEVLCRLEK
jgi:hypothetical protein